MLIPNTSDTLSFNKINLYLMMNKNLIVSALTFFYIYDAPLVWAQENQGEEGRSEGTRSPLSEIDVNTGALSLGASLSGSTSPVEISDNAARLNPEEAARIQNMLVPYEHYIGHTKSNSPLVEIFYGDSNDLINFYLELTLGIREKLSADLSQSALVGIISNLKKIDTPGDDILSRVYYLILRVQYGSDDTPDELLEYMSIKLIEMGDRELSERLRYLEMLPDDSDQLDFQCVCNTMIVDIIPVRQIMADILGVTISTGS